MLLALAVGVAGFCGLLALRQPPVILPASPGKPIAELERPAHLRPAPEFARSAMPAAAPRARPERTVVPVRIRGLDSSLRDAAGIAVFDAATGSGFTWTPLAQCTEDPDGSLRIPARTNATHNLCVTLATAREFARHGYVARTLLPSAAEAVDAAAEVVIAAETAAVRFELPPGVDEAGPLRLSRSDDPQWIPMYVGATGITVARDTPIAIVLGAGSYELGDPLDPERRQSFTVPGPQVVTLSEELAPTRAGRP